MAFAKAQTKTITEVIGVDLSLTKTEAETLVAVLRAVGGDRFNGPRAYTDAILTQLMQAAKVRPADVHVSGYVVIDKHGAESVNSFLTNTPPQVKW